MAPILCVGETQEEHDSGRALDVVMHQLQRGLENVGDDQVRRSGDCLRAGVGDRHRAHRDARRRPQSVHGAIRDAILRTLRARARVARCG